MGYVLDRIVKTGELRCCGFTDIRNGESEKPARKRQTSRSLDRLNGFGGIFVTENAREFLSAEIQFSKLIRF